jgi:hypothetical protein
MNDQKLNSVTLIVSYLILRLDMKPTRENVKKVADWLLANPKWEDLSLNELAEGFLLFEVSQIMGRLIDLPSSLAPVAGVS